MRAQLQYLSTRWRHYTTAFYRKALQHHQVYIIQYLQLKLRVFISNRFAFPHKRYSTHEKLYYDFFLCVSNWLSFISLSLRVHCFSHRTLTSTKSQQRQRFFIEQHWQHVSLVSKPYPEVYICHGRQYIDIKAAISYAGNTMKRPV